MLIARIYGLIWLLVLAAGGVLYFTDSFSAGTAVLYGFIVSTLVGSGLIAVYPSVMTERHSPAYRARKAVASGSLGRTPKISGGGRAAV